MDMPPKGDFAMSFAAADEYFGTYAHNSLHKLVHLADFTRTLHGMVSKGTLPEGAPGLMLGHKETLEEYFGDIYPKFPVMILRIDGENHAYTRLDITEWVWNRLTDDPRPEMGKPKNDNTVLDLFIKDEIEPFILFLHTLNSGTIQRIHTGKKAKDSRHPNKEPFKNSRGVKSNLNVAESIMLNVYQEVRGIVYDGEIVLGQHLMDFSPDVADEKDLGKELYGRLIDSISSRYWRGG